jgi:hypothetical protein
MALAETNVSEEYIAFIIRVKRIIQLERTSAVARYLLITLFLVH